MKHLFLLLGLASGCATFAAPRLPFNVDPGALPKWDDATDAKTGELVCRKCGQKTIRPTWYRDQAAHECLLYRCSNCGALYCTQVAKVGETKP